jgi:copper chaperone CopZ
LNTTTYDVAGMTCGHCIHAVTGELTALGGVRDVRVDVPAGKVTVRSDRPLDLGVLRTAIDAAGYELTGVSA